MELWIRSQDRELLVKTKGFELQYTRYDEGCQIFAVWQNNYQCVGKYKTKGRALEILDEISTKIRNSYLVKNHMLLNHKELTKELNSFKELLGDVIIQTPSYDIEPINNNVVYYEMPKE